MAIGDLTTLANLEAWLKLQPGNADEALLARLITAASAFAQGPEGANRQFGLANYSETKDGNGNSRMPFGNPPVAAVSSVIISGQPIPAGDAFQTPGYYYTPTRLMLNGYRFDRGLGNIQIAYQAGWASVPADVEQAVIEIAAYAYRERDRLGLSSQAQAGETTAYVIKDAPPRAASTLKGYRRVAPT